MKKGNVRDQDKLSSQQEQTRSYFHRKAVDWDAKARGAKEVPRVNVINERNEYVLQVVHKRNDIRQALDVGCGVGDLVVALIKEGIETIGIDFAAGMIDLARERASEIGGGELVVGNYFDFRSGENLYDLIVANGFLEYISFAERDAFLARARSELKAKGSLVVSSRNRLFNLYSSNEYTGQELKEGDLNGVVNENIAWSSGMDVDRAAHFEAADVTDESIRHANTGVGVSTRYQYTPVQLIKIINDAGFEVEAVSPIHVHGVLPAMKNDSPALHKKIADELHQHATEEPRFLPQSSAFMVHARKRNKVN